MGTSLTGLTPSTTYDALIKVGDNAPLDGTLKTLSDGLGNDSVLALSTTSLQIGGATGATWDNTNKRLGIGTNAPTLPVDILGGVSNGGLKVRAGNTFNENILDIANNGGTKGFYYRAGDNVLQFYGYDFSIESQSSSGSILLNSGAGSGEVRINGGSGGRLSVKGSGSTSATTSLLVQNSAGSSALTITDDRLVVIGTTIQSDNFAIGQSNALLKGITQSGSRIVINYVNGGGARFSNSSSGVSTLIVGEVSENIVSFGGITSSFPALKRASNNLEVKNADDTFGAGLSVGAALNASAILQADSTTKGFLPPRMTTTERNAIASPAAGLMIYNTTTAKLNVYTTAWEAITSL
jgi:hypothetical protein